MPRKPKTQKNTEIDSIKHPADTRKNIPTEELRGFVSEQEHQAKKVRYPRNPDLDPQLVWKGKEEQDSEEF
jgi:adenine-specific DNA-methyltransferase